MDISNQTPHEWDIRIIWTKLWDTKKTSKINMICIFRTDFQTNFFFINNPIKTFILVVVLSNYFAITIKYWK